MFSFWKKEIKVPNWGIEVEKDFNSLTEKDIEWLDAKAARWARNAQTAELFGVIYNKNKIDTEAFSKNYRDFYSRAAINELNLRIPKRDLKNGAK